MYFLLPSEEFTLYIKSPIAAIVSPILTILSLTQTLISLTLDLVITVI